MKLVYLVFGSIAATVLIILAVVKVENEQKMTVQYRRQAEALEALAETHGKRRRFFPLNCGSQFVESPGYSGWELHCSERK